MSKSVPDNYQPAHWPWASYLENYSTKLRSVLGCTVRSLAARVHVSDSSVVTPATRKFKVHALHPDQPTSVQSL